MAVVSFAEQEAGIPIVYLWALEGAVRHMRINSGTVQYCLTMLPHPSAMRYLE